MENKKLTTCLRILILFVVFYGTLIFVSAEIYPTYDSETDCRNCHGITADRHHLLAANGTQCMTCHQVKLDNQSQSYYTEVIRNCLICHQGKNHQDSHHLLVAQGLYVCSDCHPMKYDNISQTYSPEITWDCTICHSTVLKLNSSSPTSSPAPSPDPIISANDNTTPQITINSPINDKVYILNQNIIAEWSASDPSGIATTIGTSPNGESINTTITGAKNFSVYAEDNTGNNNTKSVIYYVRYNFGGFLQPIENDESSIFRVGSKVRMRFGLHDANDNDVSTANAILNFSLVSPTITGKYLEQDSYDTAIEDGFIRYDRKQKLYWYNIKTEGLQTGTWQVKVIVDDGSIHIVNISLKR